MTIITEKLFKNNGIILFIFKFEIIYYKINPILKYRGAKFICAKKLNSEEMCHT